MIQSNEHVSVLVHEKSTFPKGIRNHTHKVAAALVVEFGADQVGGGGVGDLMY